MQGFEYRHGLFFAQRGAFDIAECADLTLDRIEFIDPPHRFVAAAGVFCSFFGNALIASKKRGRAWAIQPKRTRPYCMAT